MAQTLRVLLWKTYVLRKRRWIITLFEIIIPILIFWFMVHFKNLIPGGTSKIINDTYPDRYNQLFQSAPYKLAYTPSNQFTDSIMNQVYVMLNRQTGVKMVSEDSEDAVVLWLRQQYDNETRYSDQSSSFGYVYHTPGIGVIFQETDSNKLSYTLRTTYGLQTSTNTLYGEQTGYDYLEYGSSGFTTVQALIDQVYLAAVYNYSVPNNVMVGSIPYVDYLTFDILTVMLPLVVSLGFNFVMPSLLRGIIEEKTSGIKEMMKIMGLKSWINWINWMAYSLFIEVPVTLVVAVLLTTDSGTGPCVNVNVFTLWALFLLFAITLVTFIFALSCFFTNGTICLIVGLILWYAVTIVLNNVFISQPDEYSLWVYLVTCLWPSIPLLWAINTMLNFQKNGHVWTLAHLMDDGAGGGRVTVGLAVGMLLVDIVVYSLITWYVESVMPGPYGRAKPFTFIFQCFKKSGYDAKSSSSAQNSRNYEATPNNARVGIKIENLRKTFNGGKVVAVENVDLEIYEGNITALLGHNGAGKTTTMSMLAGFFSPTKGRVIVKGKNIFDNIDDFRSSLGLCPQHNLLFSFFTVIEHLIFFGMLKGLTPSQSDTEGMQLLRTLKIDAKRNELVSKLSGGMKRKLCLSIALMGEPEVLMLDEPTSGLDPESRRLVWDVLLGTRGERTTIITTHFMEEADVLGDRIAIMDHGQVSCYGTSMFLKKLYGTGYHLDLIKQDAAPVPPITRVVEEHVTSATLNVESSSQISYNIKQEESHKFSNLFSALDNWRNELGLISLSVSYTTLEDVFLKVAHTETESHAESNGHYDNELSTVKYKKIKGCGLLVSQFKALVYKRMLTRLRSWISTLIFMILPILLMMYTLHKSMEQDLSSDQPSLPISLRSFPNTQVAVSAQNQSGGAVLDQLVSDGGATLEPVPQGTDLNSYLAKKIDNSLIEYERQMIAGFVYDSLGLLGGYSRYFTHSLPLVLNMLANTLLRQINPSGSISVANHPISIKAGQDVCDLAMSAENHVFTFPFISTFLSLGLVIAAMGVIAFPLRERVSSAKRLQLMTGVSPLLYWLTTFLCDVVMYIITAALMVVSVYIFQDFSIYSSSGYMGTLVVIFILFGISGFGFAYFFSFIASTSIKAAAVFLLINMLTGTVAAVFLSLLGRVYTDYDVFIYVFSLNPIFAATVAFSHLLSVMYINGSCLQCGKGCQNKLQDPLQFFESGQNAKNPNGIYTFLIFLVADAVLYFLLVMMIEYGIVKKLWFNVSKLWIKFHNEVFNEDEDVRTEKDRVTSSESVRGYISNTSVLRVKDLGKKYNRKMTAVHGITFQVGRGECFGLLGVNGAGKTTTFKMLTGEEVPNKGDASILQSSLRKHRSKFLAEVGYCPQFDAINKLLTGREMLYVYALLRGIPSSHCHAEVSRWIQVMGLKEYGDRPCGTYSGGNKRKLSTAMAFIGEPPVVFLDEPTSGVDPVSRRHLWGVVAACQAAGQAIILTSHSMEECETLCSRLTIMVGGQMKCIGTAPYLKHKFGQGFTIKIKLMSSHSGVVTLKGDMSNHFRGCAVKDEHLGLLHYHVPDPSTRLSEVFTKMEMLKRRHDIIEDYLVADTSLEEVFMSFARADAGTTP